MDSIQMKIRTSITMVINVDSNCSGNNNNKIDDDDCYKFCYNWSSIKKTTRVIFTIMTIKVILIIKHIYVNMFVVPMMVASQQQLSNHDIDQNRTNVI